MSVFVIVRYTHFRPDIISVLNSRIAAELRVSQYQLDAVSEDEKYSIEEHEVENA